MIFKDITKIKNHKVHVTIFKHDYRKKLIRWMFDVILDFNYSMYTIMRSINLMESYIPCMTESTEDLQLVATTCLFVTAKLEENKTIDIQYYSYVSGYSADKIKKKEILILNSVNFSLLNRIPNEFLKVSHLKMIGNDYDRVKEILNTVILGLYEKYFPMKSYYEIYMDGLKYSKKIINKNLQINSMDESVRYYIMRNKNISNK